MAGGKPTGIKNHGPQPLLIGLKHIMHSLRFYSPKPPTTLCKQPRKPGTKITQNQMVIIFHLKLAKTPMSRPPNITVLIFLCPMNYSILSLLYQHLKMFKAFILTQPILNPEPVPPTTCGAKSSLLLSQRAAPLADMLRRTQWRPHWGGPMMSMADGSKSHGKAGCGWEKNLGKWAKRSSPFLPIFMARG